MGDKYIFEGRKVILFLKLIVNFYFCYFIKWNIRKLNIFFG